MDIEILKQLILNNKSTYEIAEELNKSQTTVRYWLNKHNLKTNVKSLVINETHKTCGKCKESKLHTEFYGRYETNRNNNISSYCKQCSNFATAERQRDFKQKCLEYKGGKCIVCNYNKYIGALEFHHLDPKQKDFSLSDMSSRSFTKEIKKELDKCILVCSNCHKEIHGNLVPVIGFEPTSLSV